MKFERQVVADLVEALTGGPPLLQIVTGPRQVGKTTAALALEERLAWPAVVAAADVLPPPGSEWIETQWERARRKASEGRVLLVLDEVQKVSGWGDTVKRLWDEDRRSGSGVAPVLLGSSALLVQKGMAESLAGRFMLHRCMHWSYPECREAFDWDLDRWLFFGGYPGAAPFIGKPKNWARYIADSLIETAIGRDVLQMQTVAKPALLRHLFGLCAAFPAQIFSYNKMLGQLMDAGNTTTLANYLHLLGTAFLASGLVLFSAGQRRKRGSSPKLILWNNALVNALSTRGFRESREDAAWWGRLVENSVGAKLLNELPSTTHSVTYWRSGPEEMDFVVQRGAETWGVEVKSGRSGKVSGLGAFRARYAKASVLLVGSTGIPLEEFFETPAGDWF